MRWDEWVNEWMNECSVVDSGLVIGSRRSFDSSAGFRKTLNLWLDWKEKTKHLRWEREWRDEKWLRKKDADGWTSMKRWKDEEVKWWWGESGGAYRTEFLYFHSTGMEKARGAFFHKRFDPKKLLRSRRSFPRISQRAEITVGTEPALTAASLLNVETIDTEWYRIGLSPPPWGDLPPNPATQTVHLRCLAIESQEGVRSLVGISPITTSRWSYGMGNAVAS